MLTYFLALVMGWYLVIASTLLLFRRDIVLSSMRQVMEQPGLLLAMGFMSVIIGLLLVISHNFWIMGWPVIITIFSWLILIGGLVRIFSPDCVHQMWGKMQKNPNILTVMGVILLLLGLFLLFHGYYG